MPKWLSCKPLLKSVACRKQKNLTAEHDFFDHRFLQKPTSNCLAIQRYPPAPNNALVPLQMSGNAI